ncbi:MAG: 5-oxoprolinase subunit PxpB [Anaerolineales bacterium]|nr:5-oxoprolinase subunit PxpB [Anaerolineales bacterium]
MKPKILPLGDSSALVSMGDEIDFDINQRVHALSKLIEASSINGIIETVPAYATLLIHYDPLTASFSQIKKLVQEKIDQVEENAKRKPRQPYPAERSERRRVEVPVRYGGEYGMDLQAVASKLNLSAEDVVRIHSEKIYTVYMMGFMPGYPYMGKLDDRLIVPRLETPRTRVAAGTVAIAGSQTGIYSVGSPGGWNLIGWTLLNLFDPESESPFLFSPGDEVKFVVEHVA